MKIQQKCDWLFIFYIQEDQELAIFLERLFTTLNGIERKREYSIWIIRQKAVTEDNIVGRYKLDVQTFDAEMSSSQLVSVPLDLIGTSEDDPNGWIISLRYIIEHIEHSRKAIFTWSHACGFGINTADTGPVETFLKESIFFRDKIEDRQGMVEIEPTKILLNAKQFEDVNESSRRSLLENKSLKPLPTDRKLAANEFYIVEKSENFDCGKLELLWMSDFCRELEELKLEKRFDLMIMVNCYMQLFENGFMLRNVVDVLIGPETTMWAYGYDYDRIFSHVANEPGIATDQLAKNIVSDYVAMHRNMGHDQYLADTLLFANRLDKYESINRALQETTTEVINRIDDLKPKIKKLRAIPYFKTVSRRGGLFLLDLELWVKTLYEKELLHQPDFNKLEAFLQLTGDTRVAAHIGAGIISSDNAGPGRFGYGGCSLFFPEGITVRAAGRFGWCEYLSGSRTSPFQDASNWDELLKVLNG